MDESSLHIPETFDASDPASVVAAFAPELEPVRPPVWPHLFVWILVLLTGGALLIGPAVSSTPPGLLVVLALSVAGSRLTTELAYRRSVARFEETIEKRPYELFEGVAAKFREEVEEHRERLLAPDTEWQRTRAELRRAADDATRSLGYWTDRWLEDQRSEMALSHRETAKRLHEKLAGAVRELDRREEALLTFFRECESRIRLIERSRRDHEESERLAQLSRHTDDLIVDATLAIEEIGRQFVQEAIRVGQALGALDRLQLKNSAGEVAPDDVERVAERILEAAGEEERQLSRLVARVSA